MRDAPAALAAVCLLATSIGVAACGGASPAPVESLTGAAAARAAAANPVTVSPLPGTVDASSKTQISFLGADGTRVSDVQVVGSSSGVHAGVVRAYSTGTGESFLPSRPFRAGESVSVRALVSAGGGRALRVALTTFKVADPAPVSQAEFPAEPGDPRAVQRYSSAPGLSPSAISITTPARPSASPGYLFLAPYQGHGAQGPMIADASGNLVWFHPLPAGQEATNFGVQRYGRQRVLTWWQGRILQLGFGQGEDVLYDRSYRPVAEVRAGNSYQADLHIIRLTPQGTAWIDVFEPVRLDLSAQHGPSRGVVVDPVVQEIDVRTGLVMWEWHALGHVPMSESRVPIAPGGYPWDYAHLNSLDVGPGGDLLLSARNTWALYDVDIHSGAIRWQLGGTNSSFKLGPGTRFYWQHDAEFQPGGEISAFDNGADPPEEPQSRGVLLRADTRSRTVRLVRQFVNPTTTLLASSQGNALRLSGGNWLVGYGRLPRFTEFDRRGNVLFDGALGRGVQDFTTLLYPWSGHPASTPSLAAHRLGRAAVSIAASWNGATGVVYWRILAGASSSLLRPIAQSPARGFETTIGAHTGERFLAAQALDRRGAVLGTSATVGV